jgi:NADH:ubiquinone oxidoreductase subunit E
MNTRIRELARTAGVKLAQDESLALGYLTTSQRKFAELIVQGCLDECWYHTPKQIADNIRKRFGINS